MGEFYSKPESMLENGLIKAMADKIASRLFRHLSGQVAEVQLIDESGNDCGQWSESGFSDCVVQILKGYQ